MAANRVPLEDPKNGCFRTSVQFNRRCPTNRFGFGTFVRIKLGFTKIMNAHVRKPLLILIFLIVILLGPIII